MSANVKTERLEEGVFLLRLDDGGNDNRLTPELCAEWMAALRVFAAEPSIKVLLVAGTERVFCAGASLDSLRKLSAGEVEMLDLELPDMLLRFPVPIVAALEGHAVGGGLTAALCCDIVVAAKEKRYAVNFARLGFVPGMGTMTMLPAIVGHHFASEMILTGKFYRGEELGRRGLFNYAVPSAEVFAHALDIARQLAERPRHVLEMVKATLALPRRKALLESMSREHLMHQICFARPETAELIEESYLGRGGDAEAPERAGGATCPDEAGAERQQAERQA